VSELLTLNPTDGRSLSRREDNCTLVLAKLLCSHSTFYNMHLDTAVMLSAAAGQTCLLLAEVKLASAMHR